MNWNKQITTFCAVGLLFLTGCNVTTVRVATSLISVYAGIQRAEAARLDKEAKRLILEGIKENGESVTVIEDLTEREIEEILKTGQLEVEMSDGKKVVLKIKNADSPSFSKEIEDVMKSIKEGDVAFSGNDGQFSGKVTEAWIQENSNSENSGAAAKITWNDNVSSSILFLENSRVRVWEKGTEYGGKWYWDSTGSLRVEMDAGSQYNFGS